MNVSSLNIGPVVTTPYNFKATRASPSNVKGFRRVTYSGTIEQVLAEQLDELVTNPATRQTIGTDTGVLEYVTSSSTGMRSINGYHLLVSFESSLSVDPIWPYADFTLQTVFLGDSA